MIIVNLELIGSRVANMLTFLKSHKKIPVLAPPYSPDNPGLDKIKSMFG